ncbi:MAG TPA: ABC transporter permease [Chitinophagaceae bacterium]|nr:ABC transporter permease [Chitinophagaceae bacterium]
MIKNYLKTAFRNLWRYKSYTFINIIGLGVGIAAMVWGYQNYRFSFSFDKFHPDIDNVYRGLTFRQGGEGVYGVFPMAAVQSAKNDFFGVTEVARVNKSMVNIKSPKDETFTEVVDFTNPSFFKLFNFPLVEGDNDLNDRSAVLITQKTAEKYFGRIDPIGKTLLFYAGENFSLPLTVTGVLRNPPVNSTLQFDLITSLDNVMQQNGTRIAGNDWSLLLDAAYFKIPNESDVPAIANGMKKYLAVQNNARQDWKISGFQFISLRENASLYGVIQSNSLFHRPSDAAAYGAFITAILILLCTCLNFSNTTVARYNGRLKEIGIRKVMGGTQRQLIMQMLLECSVMVFAAILLSVLLNHYWLPLFNHMFVYVDVQANYLGDMNLLLFLTGMFIFTTLLAGAYPAFYISRYNPSSIFRGSIKFGDSNLFSRIMLGLQITISLIAVIGGIGFAKNAAFQNTFDFGFNIHNTVGVSVKDKNTYDALKNEMTKLPQITALAGTKNHIGFDYTREVAEAEGIKKETRFFEVGTDYVQTMNLKMAAGRTFDPALLNDFSTAILVTEKFAAMYGWKPADALGKQVHIDKDLYSVVGVLKDFHPATLFEPAFPVVMKLAKEDDYRYLILQSRNKDLTSVYNTCRDIWKKLFPLQPFNAFYQDQMIAESYRTSTSIAKIFLWLAIITGVLTATGLFALISLTLLKRRREIAVRKVVGATSRDIYLLINKGYFWIVLAGTVLGCYAGWSLANLLLNQIYRINNGISTFTMIISVVMMILVALVTTGIKVWQAIKAKPVNLLRTE